MNNKRLRKETSVPRPFRNEDYQSAARLPRIELESGLVIEYSSSATYTLGDDEPELFGDTHHLRGQDCTAWLLNKGESVGGLVLRRYEVPYFMTDEEFLDQMDMRSGEEHELSVVLVEQFEDFGENIGSCGDVLEINRVWLATSPKLVGKSDVLISEVIRAFCPNFALLVLKAFPLEYENQLPDTENTALSEALERRKRAMVRFYRHVLGVTPMDGERGNEGWMYRLRDGLEI